MPISVGYTKEQYIEEAPNLYSFILGYCAENDIKITDAPEFGKSGKGRLVFLDKNKQIVSVIPTAMPVAAREEFRIAVAKNKGVGTNVALNGALNIPYQKFRKLYPKCCRFIDGKLNGYTCENACEIVLKKASNKRMQILEKKGDTLTVISTFTKGDTPSEFWDQIASMRTFTANGSIEKMELMNELHDVLPYNELSEMCLEHIRKTLALSNKKLTVAINEKIASIEIIAKINGYDKTFSEEFGPRVLKNVLSDGGDVKAYFVDKADSLIQKMQGEQDLWSFALKFEYLKGKSKEYRAIVTTAVNECLSSMSLTDNGISWDTSFRDQTIKIKFQYQGILFPCVISKKKSNSITTIFDEILELSWLASYVEVKTVEEDGVPVQTYTIDIKPLLDKKLNVLMPKLMDRLNKIKLNADANQLLPENISKIKKELEQCEIDYRVWRIPYIDGAVGTLKAGTFSETSVQLSLNAPFLSLKNAVGTWYVDGKRIKKEWSDAYQIHLNRSKMMERCRTYAKDAFEPYSNIKCDGSSAGILYGDTKLSLDYKGLNIRDYAYKTPPYTESVTAWRKALSANIKNIQKEFENLEKARFEAFCKKYKLWFDSYLARHVMQFIEKNERYITENAVVQAMRGLKIALDTSIVNTEGCNRYCYLENEVIQETIRALHRQGMLTSVTLKGTFGRFDILKIGDAFRSVQLAMIAKEKDAEWSEKKCADIQNRLRTQQAITDPEADVYFQHVILPNIESLEPAMYMEMLSMIHQYYVFWNYQEQINNCFKNAPDVIKQFVKMRYAQATTKEKKIYKNFFGV